MPRKNTVKRGGNGSITPVTNFVAKYGSDGIVKYPSAIFEDLGPDEKIFKPWDDPINNRKDNPDEDKALKYKSEMTLIKLDNKINDICNKSEIEHLKKIIEMINRSNDGTMLSESIIQEYGEESQVFRGGYFWDNETNRNIDKESFLNKIKLYKSQFTYACMQDPQSRVVFTKQQDELSRDIIRKYCYTDEDDIKAYFIKSISESTMQLINMYYKQNFTFAKILSEIRIDNSELEKLYILYTSGISIHEIIDYHKFNTNQPIILSSIKVDDKVEHDTLTEYEYTLKTKSIKFDEIIKYIDTNNIRQHSCVYINCNPYYKYLDCSVENCPQHILKVEYNCMLYNKDIVSAYEDWILTGGGLSKVSYTDIPLTEEYKNEILNHHVYDDLIYSNNEAINLFIKEQCEYLATKLSIEQKRIIQDYTKIDTAFEFYQIYKRNDIKKFGSFRDFSDSFYSQIHKIYPDIFNFYYKLNHHVPANETPFKHWLNNPRSIGEHGKGYIVGKKECRSIFADEKNIDWVLILEQFINDITELILNAPTVKMDIQGYRGVSGHYIHQTEEAQQAEMERIHKKSDNMSLEEFVNDMSVFTSERLGSITFDFNISKGFYKKFYTQYSCMYRTTIAKNCKVLLIAPLSVFRHEFEILTPPDSVFSYVKSISNDNEIPATSNNINNHFGIIFNQEFKTYNNILIKTPQIFEKYIKQKSIIKNLHLLRDNKRKTAETVMRALEIFGKALGKRNTDIYINTKIKSIIASSQPTAYVEEEAGQSTAVYASSAAPAAYVEEAEQSTAVYADNSSIMSPRPPLSKSKSISIKQKIKNMFGLSKAVTKD